jgi:hypothetical protein
MDFGFDRDGRWENTTFRVVYGKDYYGNPVVNHVFAEVLFPNRYDRIANGNMMLQSNVSLNPTVSFSTGSRVGHNVSTDDIYGLGDLELEKDDRVLIYHIGTEGLVGIKKADAIGGTVTRVPDNEDRLEVDGVTYVPTRSVPRWYSRGPSKEMVGTEVTVYLMNNSVFEIIGVASTKQYAYVVSSGTNYGSTFNATSASYHVDLLLEDNTRVTREINWIRAPGAANSGSGKQNAATNISSMNNAWAGASTATGAKVQYRRAGDTVFGSPANIDNYVFEITGLTSTHVNLTVIATSATVGTTGTGTNVSAGTRFGSAHGSVLRDKFITTNTVTFVHSPQDGGTYRAYTGATVPNLDLGGGAPNGGRTQLVEQKVNYSDLLTSDAARAVLISAAGQPTSRTDWAIAMGVSYRVGDGTTTEWRIDVMMPDGTEDTLISGSTNRFADLRRGQPFGYRGSKSAVSGIEIEAFRGTTGTVAEPVQPGHTGMWRLQEVVPSINGLRFTEGTAVSNESYLGVSSSARFYIVASDRWWFPAQGPLTIAEAADAIDFSYLINKETETYFFAAVFSAGGGTNNVVVISAIPRYWGSGSHWFRNYGHTPQANVVKNIAVVADGTNNAIELDLGASGKTWNTGVSTSDFEIASLIEGPFGTALTFDSVIFKSSTVIQLVMNTASQADTLAITIKPSAFAEGTTGATPAMVTATEVEVTPYVVAYINGVITDFSGPNPALYGIMDTDVLPDIKFEFYGMDGALDASASDSATVTAAYTSGVAGDEDFSGTAIARSPVAASGTVTFTSASALAFDDGTGDLFGDGTIRFTIAGAGAEDWHGTYDLDIFWTTEIEGPTPSLIDGSGSGTKTVTLGNINTAAKIVLSGITNNWDGIDIRAAGLSETNFADDYQIIIEGTAANGVTVSLTGQPSGAFAGGSDMASGGTFGFDYTTSTGEADAMTAIRVRTNSDIGNFTITKLYIIKNGDMLFDMQQAVSGSYMGGMTVAP